MHNDVQITLSNSLKAYKVLKNLTPLLVGWSLSGCENERCRVRNPGWFACRRTHFNSCPHLLASRVPRCLETGGNFVRWMNGWMGGRMGRWMDGWVDGLMDWWMGVWVNGWVDGLMDGWMDGSVDEQKNGWTNRLMNECFDSSSDRQKREG